MNQEHFFANDALILSEEMFIVTKFCLCDLIFLVKCHETFEISVSLVAAKDKAALALCGFNIYMSTPALQRIIFNHLAGVSFLTPSCGEGVLIRS